MWVLISITVGLHLLILIIRSSFDEYIIETNLENYRQKYLIEHTWSKVFDLIFPVIILIVFIIKLYRGKKAVGNNV